MSQEPSATKEDLARDSGRASQSEDVAEKVPLPRSEHGSQRSEKHLDNHDQRPKDGRTGQTRGKGGSGRSRAGRRAPRRRPVDTSDQAEGYAAGESTLDGGVKNMAETDGGSERLPRNTNDASTDEDDSDDDEDEEEDDDEEDDDDDEEEEEEEQEDSESQSEPEAEAETQATVPTHPKAQPGKPEKAAEPAVKVHEKKQPYVRQVELPKEKLSTADLEAKMAAMALKNAKLIEQRKAADQDAAEYREIELQSQKAYEAQRLQQQEIDAVRRVAAERKLKKSEGREWDLEKSEEDWNRSRPYVDSMTNAQAPTGNSWGYRGQGYRGGSGRGASRGSRARGPGRGRGGRGGDPSRGQKAGNKPSESRQQAPVNPQPSAVPDSTPAS